MTPQMQPSVNLYLRLAQEAVEYVKGKVQAGSANRSEDYQNRDKKKFQKLDKQYLNIQRQTQQVAIKDAKQPVMTPNGLQPGEIIDMHDEVCMEAFVAEFSGFGNCGERPPLPTNT
jgi:thymidylate kinase